MLHKSLVIFQIKYYFKPVLLRTQLYIPLSIPSNWGELLKTISQLFLLDRPNNYWRPCIITSTKRYIISMDIFLLSKVTLNTQWDFDGPYRLPQGKRPLMGIRIKTYPPQCSNICSSATKPKPIIHANSSITRGSVLLIREVLSDMITFYPSLDSIFKNVPGKLV